MPLIFARRSAASKFPAFLAAAALALFRRNDKLAISGLLKLLRFSDRKDKGGGGEGVVALTAKGK